MPPRTFGEPGRSAEHSRQKSLAQQLFAGIAKFQGALALILVVTAGTFHYWQGWLFWGVFGASMLAVSLYFLKHDPHLVENRLKVGPTAESRPEQKRIQTVAGVLVFLTLSLPGVDHRLGWSSVPTTVVIAGDAMVTLGFAGMFAVFRENTHAFSTVRVEAEQRVISTGPYAVVRHPMYTASMVLFAGCALGLGSWWALLAVVGLWGVLVARILDEERFLAGSLPGYGMYRLQVRYRLIPRVW